MRPTNFLLWNLNKGKGKEIDRAIAALARKGVDVFVFTELPTPFRLFFESSLGSDFEVVAETTREPCVAVCSRRMPQTIWQWKDLTDRELGEPRHLTCALELDTDRSVTLIAAHLRSGVCNDLASRESHARMFMHRVRTIEDTPYPATILLGDFNLNPFVPAMIQPEGFHAMPTKGLAATVGMRSTRLNCPTFYNPMWACFGDDLPQSRSKTPPGTYYYEQAGEHDNYFWHILDQVLLRPAVMHCLQRLEIVDRIGRTRLAGTNGRPDATLFSDHFPVRFVMNFGKIENDPESR